MGRNVGKEENVSLDFLSEVECVELEHELAYSACMRHCSAKQECSEVDHSGHVLIFSHQPSGMQCQ